MRNGGWRRLPRRCVSWGRVEVCSRCCCWPPCFLSPLPGTLPQGERGCWPRRRPRTTSRRCTPTRRRSPGAALPALLLVPLLLAPISPALAQTTPSLTLDPTTISGAVADLDGATITLIPKNVSFLGAGTQNSQSNLYGRVADAHRNTSTRLVINHAGELTLRVTALNDFSLTGAPTGLTIASGKFLAIQTGTAAAAHGTSRHRSIEITLAYSGSAITADDTVTVTVHKSLFKPVDGNGGSPDNDLTADFTITAVAPSTPASPSPNPPSPSPNSTPPTR